MHKYQGFTLLEVLIALAILAISLTALMKTSSSDIEDATYLKEKSIALWVAKDIANRTQLNLISANNNGSVKMFNQDWHWQTTEKPTPTKAVSRLIVSISRNANTPALVTLETFKETT